MTATDLGFIYRFEPPLEKSAPTLLLLHGTGGDEDDLVPFGRTLMPKAALLSPRGQVLENGMPRFFRRLAEGVFDQKDLIEKTAALAQFIDEASATHGLNSKPIIAVGFSNGANIAASLLLRFPNRLSAAILMRAMIPFTVDKAPDLRGKRILLLSGNKDPIVPLDQPPTLAGIFRSGGATVDLEWVDAGHGLAQADVSRARNWVQGNFDGLAAAQ